MLALSGKTLLTIERAKKDLSKKEEVKAKQPRINPGDQMKKKF